MVRRFCVECGNPFTAEGDERHCVSHRRVALDVRQKAPMTCKKHRHGFTMHYWHQQEHRWVCMKCMQRAADRFFKKNKKQKVVVYAS